MVPRLHFPPKISNAISLAPALPPKGPEKSHSQSIRGRVPVTAEKVAAPPWSKARATPADTPAEILRKGRLSPKRVLILTFPRSLICTFRSLPAIHPRQGLERKYLLPVHRNQVLFP